MSDSGTPVGLITGGATGIGRACAVRLARRGFDVVVNFSRSNDDADHTATLVRKEGQRCMTVQCDVSSTEQVTEMVAQLSDRFGRLDVLVNSAGTTQFLDNGDLDLMTDELWDQILSVNLKGPFHCVRATQSLLRASDQAAIVNISSVAGIRGTGSCHAYTASKGGLNALTKSLALALAPTIRVNAVCPGPVGGRWMQQKMTSEQLAKEASVYPLPRPATPDDIASAVVYLALDALHSTGQLLVVDGGRTMS